MKLTLRPERLVAGGDALARHPDGRVVFVAGALPGEEVEAEVVTDKRDYLRAQLTAVVNPVPERLVPPCPHRRAGCGGCDWMHLAPDGQRAAKVGIVRESLRRVGRLDARHVDRLVADGGAIEPTAARTTLRVVGDEGGRPAFRESGSARTVPVDACLVAHPLLSQVLGGLRIEPGAEVTLRVSATDETLAATWTPLRRGVVEGLPAGTPVGDEAVLTEVVAGRSLQVSMGSFFQSGLQAAELLVAAVERSARAALEHDRSTTGPTAAGPTRTGTMAGVHALDAYGGIGLFAATSLAPVRRVTVLESSALACRDARANLVHRPGDAATVVRSEVAQWRPDPADPVGLIVADPARPGLAAPGVAALVAAVPAPIVLVSCDPVSLARDARLLGEHGYRPGAVEVLDLYPHTHHVETVSWFTHVLR